VDFQRFTSDFTIINENQNFPKNFGVQVSKLKISRLSSFESIELQTGLALAKRQRWALHLASPVSELV
jgi:hypothetical protein